MKFNKGPSNAVEYGWGRCTITWRDVQAGEYVRRQKLHGLLHAWCNLRQMLVAENCSLAARQRCEQDPSEIKSPDNYVKTVFGDVGTSQKPYPASRNFVGSVDKATYSSENNHDVLPRGTSPKSAKLHFYGSERSTAKYFICTERPIWSDTSFWRHRFDSCDQSKCGNICKPGMGFNGVKTDKSTCIDMCQHRKIFQEAAQIRTYLRGPCRFIRCM